MGLAMLRKPQPKEQVILADLSLKESFRRYLSQIGDIIDGVIKFSPNLSDYDDLADLNARFPNPKKGRTVIVNGQGLAFFDGAVWRKADNTLVT